MLSLRPLRPRMPLRPRPSLTWPGAASSAASLAVSARPFTTSPAATMAAADWSASQYLKFDDERTRSVHDLVNRIPLPGGRLPAPDAAAAAALRIVDLGCGPGNSTAVLAERFPGADLTGIDSSPNMIDAARRAMPRTRFALADLRTYELPDAAPPHLLLANAVFQWLPRADRLPTILRLFAALPSGAVLALQMPDNQHELTHATMRAVARGEAPGTADAPWVPHLRDLRDRDPVETVAEIYDALAPLSAPLGGVDVWHAVYNHIMRRGAPDIVQWMRGTGLQPYVNALPADDADLRAAYLAAYEQRLADLYPQRVDGTVLIRYPRVFVVAVRR